MSSDRPDPPLLSGGLTVLDGAALVAGAAVSAVHLRTVAAGEIVGPAWALLLGTFLWIGLTSAGPFLYFFRRFLSREADYPRVGDQLWGMLGLPWLITTAFQGAPGVEGGRSHDLLSASLGIGLGLAALIAVGVVWGTWVVVTPREATATFAGPWTNRVGLILAITWPVQCGVGMVVLG